jgi:hypothetical protein
MTIDRESIADRAYGYPGATKEGRRAEEAFDMALERIIDEPERWPTLWGYHPKPEDENANNLLVIPLPAIMELRERHKGHRDWVSKLLMTARDLGRYREAVGRFYRNVLPILAWAGVITPEKGYEADGELAQVEEDVRRLARERTHAEISLAKANGLLADAVQFLRGDYGDNRRGLMSDRIEAFLTTERERPADGRAEEAIAACIEMRDRLVPGCEAHRCLEIVLAKLKPQPGAINAEFTVAAEPEPTQAKSEVRPLDPADERELRVIFTSLDLVCNHPVKIASAAIMVRDAADRLGEMLERHGAQPPFSYVAKPEQPEARTIGEIVAGDRVYHDPQGRVTVRGPAQAFEAVPADRVKDKPGPTMLTAARAVARANKPVPGNDQYVAVHRQLIEDLGGAIQRYLSGGALS